MGNGRQERCTLGDHYVPGNLAGHGRAGRVCPRWRDHEVDGWRRWSSGGEALAPGLGYGPGGRDQLLPADQGLRSGHRQRLSHLCGAVIHGGAGGGLGGEHRQGDEGARTDGLFRHGGRG